MLAATIAVDRDRAMAGTLLSEDRSEILQTPVARLACALAST
jgi:hypothetical protein